MAFRDAELELYNCEVKLEYRDKAHRYFVQTLEPSGSWGKQVPVKGVTAILGDTLEKKGLQTWPMGVALRELFGFYDFTADGGKRMTGFSKDKGTLWGQDLDVSHDGKEELLQLVLSASKAWTRKQAQGADIGSAVHSAIEEFVNGGEPVVAGEFPAEDLAMANLAFSSFKTWWMKTTPTLVRAEALVYSRAYKFAGAFDALLIMDGKSVLVDWKTSNASASAGAPQGVYYSYFIQSALYALAWEEMGHEPVDDLMIVSCRKDGKFDTVRASELGLEMIDLKLWAISVVRCYEMMDTTKKALMNNVKEKENV